MATNKIKAKFIKNKKYSYTMLCGITIQFKVLSVETLEDTAAEKLFQNIQVVSAERQIARDNLEETLKFKFFSGFPMYERSELIS